MDKISYMVRYYIKNNNNFSKWYNAEKYQIELINKFLNNCHTNVILYDHPLYGETNIIIKQLYDTIFEIVIEKNNNMIQIQIIN
jgi:hypothetical protein